VQNVSPPIFTLALLGKQHSPQRYIDFREQEKAMSPSCRQLQRIPTGPRSARTVGEFGEDPLAFPMLIGVAFVAPSLKVRRAGFEGAIA
jgi:hypothetical protein